MKEKIKILFVCSGNICRSPLAHKMFEKILQENDKIHQFEIDSCGTGMWHEGFNADERMRKLAHERGWTLDKISRQIKQDDFEKFDYILVMDRGHIYEIQNMLRKQPIFNEKVQLFRNFDLEATENNNEVPDPYYGGKEGFVHVYDMIERTCNHLFQHLTKNF